METTKVGDVVRLKSHPNGPKMTVNSVNVSIGVEVVWFVDGELKRTVVWPETLERVSG